MWCDYKIDESSLSVNKLKNTKTASIMCLSISQSISLFQPVIICADLFNAAVPWRRKLSTETAASAKNVRYSLTLRTREIAHYNTVPAIVKFVVDYNVSSRYNAGHDRLSKSLSFIYCISVFIKTECAAEIQILRVSVPFGICLFSDYEKYDIGFVCLVFICYYRDAVIIRFRCKSIKYSSNTLNIFFRTAVPVDCPAAALRLCIVAGRSCNIYRGIFFLSAKYYFHF